MRNFWNPTADRVARSVKVSTQAALWIKAA